MSHKKYLPLGDMLSSYIAAHDTSLSEAALTAYQESIETPLAQRVSTLETGAFLALLMRGARPKAALEIGTFTGFATLCIAEAMPEGGHITTIEKDERFGDMAARLWRAAGVTDRITAVTADARDYMAELSTDTLFDFVFIDADKGSYQYYFDTALTHLTPSGMIAIDNTLWRGEVATEATDTVTLTIQNFNDTLAARTDLRVTILPIGDGVTIVERR